MTRPTYNPQTPCEPELPKAAIRRVYEQLGGVKRAAIRLNRGKTQTYDYASMERTDELTYAQACALTGTESPALAEHLALLAGGVFLPIECASGADVRGLTAEVAREHGDAIGALIAAMADNRITPSEARSALVEVDDCLRTLCGLRALLLKAINPSG